ncbi:MAG: hypothetical protein RLZZ578_569, partial [Bacteroidota bacterium]
TGITATAGGVTATAGNITATAGNIVATAGNITATAGSVSAGTTVTAGTGITATAGGVTATAGDITATAGNIVATAGNITATAGDVTAGDDVIATDVLQGKRIVTTVVNTASNADIETAIINGTGSIFNHSGVDDVDPALWAGDGVSGQIIFIKCSSAQSTWAEIEANETTTFVNISGTWYQTSY